MIGQSPFANCEISVNIDFRTTPTILVLFSAIFSEKTSKSEWWWKNLVVERKQLVIRKKFESVETVTAINNAVNIIQYDIKNSFFNFFFLLYVLIFSSSVIVTVGWLCYHIIFSSSSSFIFFLIRKSSLT